MVLTLIDLVNGIFSMIFVAISTIVGIIIALKYFKTKENKTMLWVAFTWILIVSPWWSSSASVLVAILTGKGLTLTQYLFLGNFLVPLFIFFLVLSFTDAYLDKQQQLIIIGIFVIIGVAFEIYLVYFLIVDPGVLGELKGVVDIEFRGFLRIYLIFNILVTLILGILIALNSIKADNPEIKLRGKFLLVAFISWTFGAIADATFPLNFVTLPIIRIILISSAIEFYLGFILPDKIKNIFLK